jgi:hypothetical protein
MDPIIEGTYAVIETCNNAVLGIKTRKGKSAAFDLAREMAAENELDLAAVEEQLQNQDWYEDGEYRITVVRVPT